MTYFKEDFMIFYVIGVISCIIIISIDVCLMVSKKYTITAEQREREDQEQLEMISKRMVTGK